jgi:hypothetical protein
MEPDRQGENERDAGQLVRAAIAMTRLILWITWIIVESRHTS